MSDHRKKLYIHPQLLQLCSFFPFFKLKDGFMGHKDTILFIDTVLTKVASQFTRSRGCKRNERWEIPLTSDLAQGKHSCVCIHQQTSFTLYLQHKSYRIKYVCPQKNLFIFSIVQDACLNYITYSICYLILRNQTGGSNVLGRWVRIIPAPLASNCDGLGEWASGEWSVSDVTWQLPPSHHPSPVKPAMTHSLGQYLTNRHSI